ncbi:hypothetical protein C8F04DRAFT_279240 [Mycena alexandri]|uniref:Uncharacterized protein n=1 Tax=Mycena alexandri TaxID=1745969 RepID=A0AAD6T8L3_9AGAR|nr:hypothetical protein C8F04DRAFT_279240 [Mycena alexandri]
MIAFQPSPLIFVLGFAFQISQWNRICPLLPVVKVVSSRVQLRSTRRSTSIEVAYQRWQKNYPLAREFKLVNLSAPVSAGVS